MSLGWPVLLHPLCSIVEALRLPVNERAEARIAARAAWSKADPPRFEHMAEDRT